MSGGLMRLLAACTAIGLWGCVSYTRLDTATPPIPGWDVQARLSAPMEIRLQETTVHEVNLVAGRVLYADSDSLIVAVSRFTTASANDYPGLGTRVAIRPADVRDLEHHRLSPFRTGLALGTGAAVILGVVFSVGQLLGSSGPGGGGDRERP